MFSEYKTVISESELYTSVSTPVTDSNKTCLLSRLNHHLQESPHIANFVQPKIHPCPLSMSAMLSACRSLEEKISVIEKLQEFAMADGEEILREAGIVADSMHVLLSSSESDELKESCLELVHILAGDSSEILEEYLDEGLLKLFQCPQYIPKSNAFMAEVSVDIVFEVLAMCPLPRKDYVDQTLRILSGHLYNSCHTEVVDRILTVLGFMINSGEMVASLIASSEIPQCLISLLGNEDEAIANVALTLICCLYKRFPRTSVNGVHKKLDRFLCHRDSRIQQRANEILSLLICRTTVNSFVVRPMF